MKKNLPKQDSHLMSETKFCLGENCVPSEDYSIMASLEMCYQAYGHEPQSTLKSEDQV
jgi:hypothetical protein